MFSLRHMNKCIPKILTKFVKDSIIDVWRCSECAAKCNSIKSYKKTAAKTILKNGSLKCVNTAGNNPISGGEDS